MTSSNQAGSSAEHLIARCPNCQKKLKVPMRMAGRKAKCPQCANTLTLPTANEAEPAASAPVKKASPAATPARKAVAPTPKAGAPVRKATPLQVEKMWHVQTEDGEQYGPINQAELDEWHAEERITAETLLYCDGATDWQNASEIYPDLAVQQPVQNAIPSFDAAPSGGGSPFDFAAGDTASVTKSRGKSSSSSRQGGGRSKRGEKAPKSGLVTAVAVLEFLMGFMNLLGGVGLAILGYFSMRMIGSSGTSAESMARDPQIAAAWQAAAFLAKCLLVVGIVLLLSGFVSIAAGVGVMMRAAWGRILSLIMAGILAASVLFMLVLVVQYGAYSSLVAALPNMAFAGFIFVALLNKKAAREFL